MSTPSGPHGPSGPSGPPALPAQRTALAWSRTAVGLLANGALLIVGRDRRAGAGVVAALAGAALLLALAVALAASRRSRELRRQLRPIPLAVQHRVTALGFGVAAFALLTGLSLLR